MQSPVQERKKIQALRLDLMQHVQEGLPVADQLANVEKSLLRQLGKAVVSGEVAAAIGDGPKMAPCQTCGGNGIEQTTHRVRNRYMDVGVRCHGCDGRGSVPMGGAA